MANAFGNVWPQYRRGWQQTYGAQSGQAGAQPFVGQPAGALDPEYVGISDYPATSQETPPKQLPNYPITDRTVPQQIPNYPATAQSRGTSGTWNYPVTPSPYVDLAGTLNPTQTGAGSNPLTPPPAESRGTTGTWNYPVTPSPYVDVAGTLNPTQAGAGSNPLTPPQTVGGLPYQSWDDPNLAAAMNRGAHAHAAAQHTAAAQQHAAAAQQHAAAAQSGHPATVGDWMAAHNIAPQPQQQPGFGERLLQTLSHFFGGTLGQHPALQGQPVYQQTQPWAPRAQPVYSPSGGYVYGQPTEVRRGYPPGTVPRAQPATVGDWMAMHHLVPSQNPQSGQNPAFMGQPMGAGNNQNDPQQPVRDPSELGSQDLGKLASSGTPEHFYSMASPNALTNVGGYQGQSPFGSAQAAEQGIGKMAPSSGTGTADSWNLGGYGGSGQTVGDWMSAGYPAQGGGTTDLGTLGGGAGGAGSGTGLANAVTGILSNYANTVQQANAPVSVSPSQWANALPPPATFSWPMLQPNTGGVFYT